jgi:AraC-like DNA-binding protein/quercetin dioxygenase-like cupin family protein
MDILTVLAIFAMAATDQSMYITDIIFMEAIVMDPILASLQVEVLTATRSELLPARWNQRHQVDPFGRLYYIESGSGWLEMRGECIALRPERLYLIPAQVVHSYGTADHVIIRWLHFTAQLLGGLDLFDFLECACDVTPADPDHVAELMARIVRAFESATPASEVEQRGLLMEALALFVATADPESQAARRRHFERFRNVLAHIDSHLSAPLRVAELAELMHLDQAYFSRLFSRHFGCSPAKYITRKRIQAAQRMLLQSDDTLAALAARLGFVDAFHLSKVFKRLTGVTPSAFRAGRTPPRP